MGDLRYMHLNTESPSDSEDEDSVLYDKKMNKTRSRSDIEAFVDDAPKRGGIKREIEIKVARRRYCRYCCCLMFLAVVAFVGLFGSLLLPCLVTGVCTTYANTVVQVTGLDKYMSHLESRSSWELSFPLSELDLWTLSYSFGENRFSLLSFAQNSTTRKLEGPNYSLCDSTGAKACKSTLVVVNDVAGAIEGSVDLPERLRSISCPESGSCYFTGTNNYLTKFSISKGERLWSLEDSWTVIGQWTNFGLTVVPDINDDGDADLLVMHGAPEEALRTNQSVVRSNGRLLFVCGRSGHVLTRNIDLPLGAHSVAPPLLHTNADGVQFVVVATGVDNFENGSVWYAPLAALYRYAFGVQDGHSLPSAIVAPKGNQTQLGFIDLLANSLDQAAPPASAHTLVPLLVDVNNDGVKDILTVGADCDIALYNGQTFSPIWRVTKFAGRFKCRHPPVAGRFNADGTDDVLITLVQYAMLDGTNGAQLWEWQSHHRAVGGASAVRVARRGANMATDIFLFALPWPVPRSVVDRPKIRHQRSAFAAGVDRRPVSHRKDLDWNDIKTHDNAAPAAATDDLDSMLQNIFGSNVHEGKPAGAGMNSTKVRVKPSDTESIEQGEGSTTTEVEAKVEVDQGGDGDAGKERERPGHSGQPKAASKSLGDMLAAALGVTRPSSASAAPSGFSSATSATLPARPPCPAAALGAGVALYSLEGPDAQVHLVRTLVPDVASRPDCYQADRIGIELSADGRQVLVVAQLRRQQAVTEAGGETSFAQLWQLDIGSWHA